MVELFPAVTLPLITQFLTVTLSQDARLALATELAKRTTLQLAVVLLVVLVIVRFRLMPPVLGLSPSIVTLSAPNNSITPRPVMGLPEMVTPSLVGRIYTDV